MSDYATASDNLARAIGNANGETGFHNRIDHLTIDQQIEVAKVQALLSIAQELSLIQDQGIRPDWSPRDF